MRAYRSGKKLRISAGPSRRRLQSLRDKGLGIERIAELAGLSPRTIDAILNQGVRMVLATTADAIAQVEPRRAPGATTSGWRAQRLVADLLAEGYVPSQLAERGVPRAVRPRIRVKTERHILRVHQHLTQ